MFLAPGSVGQVGNPHAPSRGVLALPPDLTIFADGTDGFHFDFSKADQLFQDTIGTIPADDAGESVGLALEAHAWAGKPVAQVKAAAPELRPSGAGTDNDTGTGASTDDGTTITLTGVDGSNRAKRGWSLTGLVVGSRYEVSFDITSISGAGSVGLSVVANSGATNLDVSGSAPGSYRYIYTATTTTRLLLLQTSASGATASVPNASVSIKLLPGNHASQATAAAQPKYQTGGLARFDGSDDVLLTGLLAGAAMTLMFKGKMTSGSKAFMGCEAGSSACSFILNASGRLSAAIGSGGTVFSSSPDLRGVLGVGALTFDGTTVQMYWNSSQVYSGAQSGAPTTSVPMVIGARPSGGVNGLFGDLDLYHSLAIKKALTATEIQAVTEQWGTS